MKLPNRTGPGSGPGDKSGASLRQRRFFGPTSRKTNVTNVIERAPNGSVLLIIDGEILGYRRQTSYSRYPRMVAAAGLPFFDTDKYKKIASAKAKTIIRTNRYEFLSLTMLV